MTIQLSPPNINWADKRRSGGHLNTSPISNVANYVSEAALDARLTAINATSYTAARLRTMTMNDKVYAVRLNDDPTSI